MRRHTVYWEMLPSCSGLLFSEFVIYVGTPRLKCTMHNFTSCFVWLLNLVSHIKRRTETNYFRTRNWREYIDLKGENNKRMDDKLHNMKLHNFYPSPNVVKTAKWIRVKCVGHVACTWVPRRQKILNKNLKEKYYLPMCAWENNIKIDLQAKIWRLWFRFIELCN
jgi:hypothetical protein